MTNGCRSVAQATRLNPGLRASQRRFLALLLNQELGRRLPLRADKLAGLLELGTRPIVVRHFEGRGHLVFERLHLRVMHAEATDLVEQADVLGGDLGEAVGKLLALDRRLAEDLKEAGDGLDAEPTVRRDEPVKSGDQALPVTDLRRGGETYEFDNVGMGHATHDGNRAVAHIALRYVRAVGADLVAETH